MKISRYPQEDGVLDASLGNLIVSGSEALPCALDGLNDNGGTSFCWLSIELFFFALQLNFVADRVPGGRGVIILGDATLSHTILSGLKYVEGSTSSNNR